uniref:hypothetical protein n=1 Tax=Okeania sp. SIO2F4 TaxID=2607790 RepID=UPI0025FD6D7C|nr:hypothetical protein [Okeania sp. SIO2F4]
MTQTERKNSHSLIKMASLLVSLHHQKKFFPDKTYEYNYSYLPPLAMTNVP